MAVYGTINETAESMLWQRVVGAPYLLAESPKAAQVAAMARHWAACGTMTGMQAYAITAAFRELTQGEGL